MMVYESSNQVTNNSMKNKKITKGQITKLLDLFGDKDNIIKAVNNAGYNITHIDDMNCYMASTMIRRIECKDPKKQLIY